MKINKAVFPLAGLGSRMMPITKVVSKEMLQVMNKPLLHYAVEEALVSGIKDLIFVVRNNETIIRKYLTEDNISLDVDSKYNHNNLKDLISKIKNIYYVKQEEPLGLGDAILRAKNIINNESFAVLLPDDFILARNPVINQMIKQFKQLNSSVIAISKMRFKNPSQYGVLDAAAPNSNGVTKIRKLIEKPFKAPSNLAVVGRYIFTPHIFDLLERTKTQVKRENQLAKAITTLTNQQPVHGYCYKGIRFDCGNVTGLQMANFFTMIINKLNITI